MRAASLSSKAFNVAGCEGKASRALRGQKSGGAFGAHAGNIPIGAQLPDYSATAASNTRNHLAASLELELLIKGLLRQSGIVVRKRCRQVSPQECLVLSFATVFVSQQAQLPCSAG